MVPAGGQAGARLVPAKRGHIPLSPVGLSERDLFGGPWRPGGQRREGRPAGVQHPTKRLICNATFWPLVSEVSFLWPYAGSAVTRLRWHHCGVTEVANEPILGFMPGSPERAALQKALSDVKGKTEAIPCVVGGEEVWTSDVRYQVSPFNHAHKVAKYCYADKDLLNKAIDAALAARKEWDLRHVQDRAQIFFKAADILSGPRRAEVLAKTMVGQGKTIIQAEIDAAAELIDFFRFNAKYALELEGQQPLSVPPSTNAMVYRGLEGFVAAISPFNFTAIGGNLAGAPALMGNVVLWKPSDAALLSSYAVYKILLEAGLPPNVIQFVPADGPVFGDTVTHSEHLCGVNFTGSVPTFKRLWKQVSENLDRYRTFPRLAGECGGKNFHWVHASADVPSVVSGTLRSAFEYGGQKCSACSRLYAPDGLWPRIKAELLEQHQKIKVGDPTDDFGVFFSAVIDRKAFERIQKWIRHAETSPNLTVLAGGGCDDRVGYFVQPCIVETGTPRTPSCKRRFLARSWLFMSTRKNSPRRFSISSTALPPTASQGQCLPRIKTSWPKPGSFCATRPAISTSTTSPPAPWWPSSRLVGLVLQAPTTNPGAPSIFYAGPPPRPSKRPMGLWVTGGTPTCNEDAPPCLFLRNHLLPTTSRTPPGPCLFPNTHTKVRRRFSAVCRNGL
ncbi:hypothetical protein JRQ81_009987 [Phrynocephalus forsythii]|uniref:Multifunctional fusion protein n=1 Tax=Phrynocephalus forsythii TaxID=171643 RepID=A0A9Q0X9C0_9SAUR|nr:hypothetical protein JRQ81_009987 [Phrynocephalus forsythii]